MLRRIAAGACLIASFNVLATPVGERVSVVRAVSGEYIHWREHIIDDATMGVPDLTGSDGLIMVDLDQDGGFTFENANAPVIE